MHPLHRAWRALPAGARRALFARGAAWLAPRAELPAPTPAVARIDTEADDRPAAWKICGAK